MGIEKGGAEPARAVVEAPAKLNVHLRVTGRRRDGYHELVSVMIPITLTDRVEVRPGPEGIELSCTGRPVAGGEQNLVWRAAEAFLRRGRLGQGVSIHLHKRIPVAAGLGGGSSDAASTLLALDRIWPGRLGREALFRTALDLGADVPFFLSAVPALATGIGEVLERLDYWPNLWYVLIKPPIEISTAWVYGKLRIRLTTRENDYIIAFLNKKDFSVAELLENDLERVTETRFPVVAHLKQALLDAGAIGALMTGSGPTVFGVFPTESEAQAAARELVSRESGDVFVTTNWVGERRTLQGSSA
ncbi:MAG: 4-(cytidine 5'-diphospho)-2-C-methyl-D-erythritol kinase [Deltaproteobacteria bacterium]|nr:4-(cytidine 5'-diphospho)-2-C-methyl-D-erythritol kinase [Deltaproteobacteria bacterium]